MGRNNEDEKEAELSIMIAEQSSQRKGLAQEALKEMIKHRIDKYRQERFIAKISMHNKPSIQLFEKLGFNKVIAKF